MFLAWIIVANILGQTANGEIGVLRTTVSLFVALIGNGFGLTLTKYLALSKESDKRFIGKILGMSITSSIFFGLIITGLYFFLTPWISVVIFEAPHLLEVFQLNSILLFLSVLNGVLLEHFKDFLCLKKCQLLTFFMVLCYLLE
jgi:O-antigen/teichoic acid export membrane protein